MQIAFKSDRGLNRAINQDYVSYFMNEAGQPLMIVCDGMGGHKAGDVASEMGYPIWEQPERVPFHEQRRIVPLVDRQHSAGK